MVYASPLIKSNRIIIIKRKKHLNAIEYGETFMTVFHYVLGGIVSKNIL